MKLGILEWEGSCLEVVPFTVMPNSVYSVADVSTSAPAACGVCWFNHREDAELFVRAKEYQEARAMPPGEERAGRMLELQMKYESSSTEWNGHRCREPLEPQSDQIIDTSTVERTMNP